MNENSKNKWAVGSEFHFMNFEGDFITWPKYNTFCNTGRNAFLSIWNKIKKSKNTVTHIPDYFCEDVFLYWMTKGVKFKRYIDNPLKEEPDWENLKSRKGDIVLAVNYFGIRNGKPWKNWKENNPDIVLIEDHTHDPVSMWCFNSNADYAFASLRKTLPISDGAIIWSPKGRNLPEFFNSENNDGSIKKLAAMFIKKEYLSNSMFCNKEVYRNLEISGENQLVISPINSISPWSHCQILIGYPSKWREKRLKNVTYFYSKLMQNPYFRPLTTKIHEGGCPFNAILLFKSESYRNLYQRYLISNNVFCSVHWPLSQTASNKSMKLSKQLLTIPLDQRYDIDDIDKILSIIEQVK